VTNILSRFNSSVSVTLKRHGGMLNISGSYTKLPDSNLEENAAYYEVSVVSLSHSRQILGYHLNTRHNLGGWGSKRDKSPSSISSLATELKLFTTVSRICLQVLLANLCL